MNDYLTSVKKQFFNYKQLGEKAMAQVSDEQLFWQPNEESNSIATIVKHLSGNMISRWTDFLTTDGEKEWRNRDEEFENDLHSRTEILQAWNNGWACFFSALDSLQPDDLSKIIFIRAEAHTLMEAINRQLTHYPYHIGQIIYIAKMLQNENWKSLSIPRNQSAKFNAEKFNSSK
jgi:hypothetical protein